LITTSLRDFWHNSEIMTQFWGEEHASLRTIWTEAGNEAAGKTLLDKT
jgi:hypothetical protein